MMSSCGSPGCIQGARAGPRTELTAKKRGRSARPRAPRSRKRKPAGSGGQSFGLELVPQDLQLQHDDRTKTRAIAGYLKHGIVAQACAAAGVSRQTWYDWLENDSRFAAIVAEASEAVADGLELTAKVRAQNGSDTLLIFLLKTLRSKFRDREQVTVMHPDVIMRVQATLCVIASQPTWESEALIQKLSEEIWT
jgi:hypothetical protein